MKSPVSSCSVQSLQRGIAIITVMLMVALASVAVTAMWTQQRLDIYRSSNRQVQVQARKLALAGERFAVQQLHIDRRDGDRGNSDSLEDSWASPSPPFPVQGGTVAGCVVDMQGRFNLNALVDEEGKLNSDQRDMLKRLFDVLEIDPVKVSAIVDWIDSDSTIIDADGAEDDYYSLRAPAYLPANQRLTNLSELKLIKGFNESEDEEDYEILLPHISALPKTTPLNVNTATPELLEALVDFVDAGKANELSRWEDEGWKSYPECGEFSVATISDALEEGEPYETVDAFVTEINSDRTEEEDEKFENTDLIDVKSQYFEIRVDVELGELALPQISLVERDDNGIVTVQQRMRGQNLLQVVGVRSGADSN